WGNIQPFERRVIANIVGRLPVRHLPDDLSSIQIDGRDTPPWWFHQRQTLYGESSAALTATTGRGATATAGGGIPGSTAARRIRVGRSSLDVVHIRALPVGGNQ